MRKVLFTLLATGLGAALVAQTNAPVRDFGLTSKHGYYDGNAQQLVYYDQVCVTNARAQLTCGQLTLNLPPKDSPDQRPTNAVAEKDLRMVFIDKRGGTNHLTADKGVYDHRVVDGATNETFTFTGNTVRMTSAQGWLTCRQFTLSLPPMGAADSHPTNAVAETNVEVIYIDKKGETNHLTADKGFYEYSVAQGETNEMIIFSGHVTNTTVRGWVTGEPLWWDVVHDRLGGTDIEAHFRSPGTDNGTNDSPLNLLK